MTGFITKSPHSLSKHLPVKQRTEMVTDKAWITDEYNDILTTRQTAYRKRNMVLYKHLKNKANRKGTCN